MFLFFFFFFHVTVPISLYTLEEHALPDHTLAGLLFNLIRNPRGYQNISTSPFLDSFHFAKPRTNPKHHRDWKIQTSSTKYCSRPRLSFFYSISLELLSENSGYHRTSTNPWDGEFLYRITSYRMFKTICNTTWMNLCPNLESAHDSLKNRNLKKSFSYSTKTQYSKKFRISIILKSS